MHTHTILINGTQLETGPQILKGDGSHDHAVGTVGRTTSVLNTPGHTHNFEGRATSGPKQ